MMSRPATPFSLAMVRVTGAAIHPRPDMRAIGLWSARSLTTTISGQQSWESAVRVLTATASASGTIDPSGRDGTDQMSDAACVHRTRSVRAREREMDHSSLDTFRRHVNGFADALGHVLVDAFHHLALFAIGGVTVWSAVVAFVDMAATKGHASIDDILLLFIYLELGAMVGIYFKTNHMPVRFLTYVAMTALTRVLIGDVQAHHPPDMSVVLVSGAILLLALATLVIRFASSRFPSMGARSERQ